MGATTFRRRKYVATNFRLRKVVAVFGLDTTRSPDQKRVYLLSFAIIPGVGLCGLLLLFITPEGESFGLLLSARVPPGRRNYGMGEGWTTSCLGARYGAASHPIKPRVQTISSGTISWHNLCHLCYLFLIKL